MTYSVAPALTICLCRLVSVCFQVQTPQKAKAEKLNWVQKAYARIFPVSIGNLKYSANLNKKRLMKGAFLFDSIYASKNSTCPVLTS